MSEIILKITDRDGDSLWLSKECEDEVPHIKINTIGCDIVMLTKPQAKQLRNALNKFIGDE